MTEAEWLASKDPRALLAHICRQSDQPRKLRLFACAMCRLIPGAIDTKGALRAVETTEAFADGLATSGELAAARSAAPAGRRSRWAATARSLPRAVAGPKSWQAAEAAIARASPSSVAADLLREMFGNPFRRPVLSRTLFEWDHGLIRSLARAASEERVEPGGELDPARLAILSDALEEGGCADLVLLDHLRGPGPHYRGCWVLDLLLGK